MPLLQCPDCKKMVSTTATACPNCGRVIQPEDSQYVKDAEETADRTSSRNFGIILLAFIVLAIIATKTCGNS